MLMPKKVKYRKVHRGRTTGKAYRGATLTFGEYGLQATEAGLDHQHADRSGPYRDDPSHPARRKGVDQDLPRQAGDKKAGRDPDGKGRASPEYWVAVVKPGRIMFEFPESRRSWPGKRCAWPLTNCPSGPGLSCGKKHRVVRASEG